MKTVALVLTAAILVAGVARGNQQHTVIVSGIPDVTSPSRDVIWYDDMEGDVSEWYSVDLTLDAVPRFHWDEYMAFGSTGYSWWCGTFDYDADGGYGNGWDERLDIPVTDVSSSTYGYVVLTFAYRHDSEVAYDYTYLQAKSGGVYEDLGYGYDGSSSGWVDIGTYGFLLADYDNPIEARFRFRSNMSWSDEDGLYDSEGGAFACDNIRIFDFATGAVYFYDSEPGTDREGECVPYVPEAAGDYWHLIDRECPAYSDPHSWWCGDDADTGLIPPNLKDALYSPVVDLTGLGTVVACTVRFLVHFAIPLDDQDHCQFFVTCDGENYHSMGRYSSMCDWGDWRGDFGACDGWSWRAINGYDVSDWAPGPITHVGLMWVMHTTENGCGPGSAGDAGAMIDDVWIDVEVLSPAEETSWGRVKAMYR